MSLKDVVAHHVGKRLERRRQFLGMTKKQLAALASTHSKQIKRYECGEGSITASRLHHLATALAVSPDYFFEGLQGKASLAPISHRTGPNHGAAPDPKVQKEVLVLLGVYERLAERPRKRLLALVKVFSEAPRERVPTSRAHKTRVAPSTTDTPSRGRARP